MKKQLLRTTALAGLAAFAASPALAFDENNWTWNKTVEEVVDINVVINSDITPDGHFELQDRQFYTGEVVARSVISGDYLSNDAQAPADLSGTVTVPVEIPVSGVLNVSGDYDANAAGPNITSGEVNVSEVEGLDITSSDVIEDTSQISVQPSSFSIDFDIEGTASGEVEVDLADIEFEVQTLDATTEMANAAGSATAIANFKNIDSETATYLDEAQEHAADGAGVVATSVAGSIEDPVELAVELDATAISNLLTVNVATSDPNNVFIGDVSQSTDANMLAQVSTDQDLSGFNNLGNYAGLMDSEGAAISGRVATLTASAIGNFANIKVGPTVDLAN